MNSIHLHGNRFGFTQKSRKYRQRRRFRHDPWLVFNMAAFNSEANWNRVFDPFRVSTSQGRC